MLTLKDRRAVKKLLGNAKSNVRLSQLLDARTRVVLFVSTSKESQQLLDPVRGLSLLRRVHIYYQDEIKSPFDEKRARKPHLDPTCHKYNSQPESLGHVLNTRNPMLVLWESVKYHSTSTCTVYGWLFWQTEDSWTSQWPQTRPCDHQLDHGWSPMYLLPFVLHH